MEASCGCAGRRATSAAATGCCSSRTPSAWTEVPSRLKVLARQRDRWHRGLADVLRLADAARLQPALRRARPRRVPRTSCWSNCWRRWSSICRRPGSDPRPRPRRRQRRVRAALRARRVRLLARADCVDARARAVDLPRLPAPRRPALPALHLALRGPRLPPADGDLALPRAGEVHARQPRVGRDDARGLQPARIT